MNVSDLPTLAELRCYDCAQAEVTILPTQPILELLAQTNLLGPTDVDSILIALDGNALLGGTVRTDNQTPLAPPTPPGRIAYASLVAKGWTVTTDPWDVVMDDGVGGFWMLVVDTLGNVGTLAVAGPATSNSILDDGSGGFWKIVVDALGNRGTVSDPGPATAAPILADGSGHYWTLVADTLGNLGSVHSYP